MTTDNKGGQRPGWRLILGPPGTGKTTALLRYMEREMGVLAASDLAFVSFTRSARLEAKQRAARAFKCGPDELTWFRTIHSTAFRLLGLKAGNLLTNKDWTEFSKKHGYDFSSMREFREDDDSVDVVLGTADDTLLATLNWGRNRCLAPHEALRKAPFTVNVPQFNVFVRRYEAFREDTGKVDFHDMLEQALHLDERPPVRVAFIDEGQDLSPLQVAVVERWFDPCERVYVGGDDDQAIFSFQGGDPDWLLSLAKCCDVEILEKSYRVPALVHDMGRRAIQGNKLRIDKIYRAKDEIGEIKVVDREKSIDAIDESEDTFVLGRNWRMIHGFAKLLRRRGIAFTVEKYEGWSPLGSGSSTVLSAYKAVLRLQAGEAIGARECDRVFAHIPSGKQIGLLPRGSKKLVKENHHPVSTKTLREWNLFTLADRIEKGGTEVLLKIPAKLRQELGAISRRYGGNLPKPRVRLTSMHSSKGREAETVILISDMSKATYKAYTQGRQAERESENRIAYVAITRAKRRILVCRPESNRFYPYALLASKARVPERTEDDWWPGD